MKESTMKSTEFTNMLQNRKLKILYQKWHVGLITGCNKTLDEYRIAFDNVTEDYINLNSVDGIEIV